MHDHRRQVGDLRHVADQLVRLEEGIIGEVMAFDAGDRQRALRLGEAIDHQRVGPQGCGAPFPGRPGLGRVHLGDLIVAGQALVEGLDQVATLLGRNRCDVVLPVIGEQAAGASLVEPLDLLRAAQEDAAQDQAMHALGVGLGVGQGQGRAPGAAEQHPFFDAQVLADALQVFDQVPGGVVFQAGMGGRTATAALVEGDDAVQVGIEVAAALGIAASTRATMDEHHRQTFRRTALIDIQHMRCFHGQIVPGVGFDLRVQGLHYALRVGIILPLGIINLNCA
ncbi:hypothetical protein D3C77_319620 [compost metagenome]